MSSHSPNPLSLQLAWFCDKGRVRDVNEDALMVRQRPNIPTSGHDIGSCNLYLQGDSILLAVADGCGGGDQDPIARNVLQQIGDAVSSNIGDDLRTTVKKVNRYQNEESIRRAGSGSMGAALSLILIEGKEATIAQVGDTRCYRYRDDRLVQVTIDQTLVAQMVRAGELTPEEARSHKYSNVVLQAIGATSELLVNISRPGLRDNDWLLLCTDGIWKLVDDRLIEQAVRDADSAFAVVMRLWSHAMEKGGHDNLAIIAAKVSLPVNEAIATADEH